MASHQPPQRYHPYQPISPSTPRTTPTIPTSLYLVHSPTSPITFSQPHGFTAALTPAYLSQANQFFGFNTLLASHLHPPQFQLPILSPFISTLSSYIRSVELARSLVDNTVSEDREERRHGLKEGGAEIEIFEIDGRVLDECGIAVFEVGGGFVGRGDGDGDGKGNEEWLVWGYIPAAAIVERISVKELRRGRESVERESVRGVKEAPSERGRSVSPLLSNRRPLGPRDRGTSPSSSLSNVEAEKQRSAAYRYRGGREGATASAVGRQSSLEYAFALEVRGEKVLGLERERRGGGCTPS